MRRTLLEVAGAAVRAAAPRNLRAVRPNGLRLLLIRPDHLGDLLMTSPAVELLRKAQPEARLTMMVGPWGAEVAHRDPLLDEVILCPFPGFTRAPKGSPLGPYRLLWRTARELRRGRYDAALLLRFDHWWGAWLAAQAGIPVRVGRAVRECRPFLTHPVDTPGRDHWVEQSLSMARRLLEIQGVPAEAAAYRTGLRFGLREEDEEEARRLAAELRLESDRPMVAFHPGTGSPLKLWPEDRWIMLGWTLAARGARIVVTGSSGERGAAERIAAAIPDARSLAGRTGLGPLAAVFRRCALVVGTDNGPLHLAVAVDVPTVHIFGPTDPAVFGPWGDASRHRVVAAPWAEAPCGRLDLEPPAGGYASCMEAISVETVAAECVGLLRL